jgi:hypothetical protein
VFRHKKGWILVIIVHWQSALNALHYGAWYALSIDWSQRIVLPSLVLGISISQALIMRILGAIPLRTGICILYAHAMRFGSATPLH